jgi:D-alanyl-D-alanine carboxypeptidase/D-alanyl-D-alanine-endopeptidase (penicillin-binding protein 4)
MKKLTKNLLISIIFTILFVGSVQADLAQRINKIISQSSQKKVKYSIRIVKADTGNSVYEKNAKTSLIPASNMKIVTSAAALKYLGADFEYKTRIGLIDNTLVVIGSGDPLLGDEKTDSKYERQKGWIFEKIAQELRDKQIETVEDIIIDSGVFDNELVHPNWPRDQLNRWYACEVSGVNYNDNCILLTVKNVGGKVELSIEPETSFITLINEVTPITSGQGAIGAYRNQLPNRLTIKGQCRKEQGPVDVAIERTAAFFGFLLAEHLNKSGITVTGRLIEKVLVDESDFRQLTEFITPLNDCLLRSNKDSLGLVAEALMKTIAAKNNPDENDGSWEKGRELISEYLTDMGIDENDFYIDDGSGLSRENKLSSYIITKVLLSVYNSENWQMYRDSLAIGGVDGTNPISGDFKEEEYKGNVLGKTGSITGVMSLSGVCVTEQGDYIFSILANNATSRDAINDIAKAVIDEYNN